MSVANLITRGIGPGSTIPQLITAGLGAGAASTTKSVGLYYFPGWKTPGGGGPFPSAPWSVIPGDRLPLLLGAYDETQQSVCDQLLTWFHQYGITFLAIDWFQDWSGSTLIPYLDHFIDLYLTSSVDKPKVCLQWANQTHASGLNSSTANQIYEYWSANYFSDSNYLSIDGKKVVIVNSGPSLRGRFASNAEVKTFLDAADAYVAGQGQGGIYWMDGHADSSSAWIDVSAPANGWDGITGSNVYTTTRYGNPAGIQDNAAGPSPTTYADLDYAVFSGQVGDYRGFCHGWMNDPDIEVFWPPLTAGFDNSPWTPGTTLHGMPTTQEFSDHLDNAVALIEANPAQTQLTVMVEAASEYGEGSIVVPTAGNGGFTRLRLLNTKFDLPTVLGFSIQPTAVTLAATTATIRFFPSGGEPITYRMVVVADGATPPDATEVLAGTASGGGAAVYASASLTANMGDQIDLTATGLTASTAYDVYVAIDDADTSALLGTKVDITTTAASSGPGGTIRQQRPRSNRRYPTRV
jgi:hypothetical protein